MEYLQCHHEDLFLINKQNVPKLGLDINFEYTEILPHLPLPPPHTHTHFMKLSNSYEAF